MAENLPEPKSRKESYLAKAAGMDVTVPEAPESREEQYLAAIAEGGGGGGTTYTAGDGIVIENDEISADLAQTTGQSTTKLMSQKAITDALASAGGGAEFIELTTEDYNWNSSTGATGTPDCVALWLLPSGIYKGPASTSIEVRATRSQDYSMGSGFSSYAIVKECENTSTNRAIVTYVDGGNGDVVEYYSIDENGQNYSIKNFPNVVQTTGTSTTNVMSQKAVTDIVGDVAAALNAINNGTQS